MMQVMQDIVDVGVNTNILANVGTE